MKTVVLIHQHDPSIHHVGGIGTFINTFIRNAPDDLTVKFVGITAQPDKYPVGQWHSLTVGKRSFQFFPLFVADPLAPSILPLSLKMVLSLFRHRKKLGLAGALLDFHRIEPMFALMGRDNPKILILHGNNMKDFYNRQTEVRWGKFPWLYFWLEPKILPRANHIYVVREDAVADYQNRYPEKRDDISFLPTWVDEETFACMADNDKKSLRRQLAADLGIPSAAPLYLYVGRFEGQKDPLRLLKAFKIVKQGKPDAHLILIGKGSLEAQMHDFLRQNGLTESTHFLPPIPQQEVGQWMNAADALCLSSAFEGMPRVVVEALYCGLPVVTTDVGEASRLIGASEGGRLVTQPGAEAFSAAMFEILENPPTAAACRARVVDFTANRVLMPLYDKYREILENMS